MTLTPDQLQAIDRHLRKENWLLNEDLIAELTDHYATAIADRMAQGQAFNEAMIEVYKDFGWRKGLLKLEEEYQVQKERQANLQVWREMKRFFVGPRALINFGLFLGLYRLNSFSAGRNGATGFLSTGEMSLLVGFCAAFFLITLWKIQRSQATGTGWTKSFGREIAPFVRIYSMCYAILLCSKFLGIIFSVTLPDSLIQVINASLQTLTTLYFISAVIALYKREFPKSKPA